MLWAALLITLLQEQTLRILLLRGGVEKNPGPGMSALRDEMGEVRTELRHALSYISYLENDIDALESHSRRNNLKFIGIPEQEREDFDSCAAKVVQTLNMYSVQKSWSVNHIERAHRLGRPQAKRGGATTSYPRPMIVRFASWKDKLSVVQDRQAKAEMRQKGIKVAQDLTKRQRLTLQQLRDEGKQCYFKNGRLFVDGRLVENYKSRGRQFGGSPQIPRRNYRQLDNFSDSSRGRENWGPYHNQQYRVPQGWSDWLDRVANPDDSSGGSAGESSEEERSVHLSYQENIQENYSLHSGKSSGAVPPAEELTAGVSGKGAETVLKSSVTACDRIADIETTAKGERKKTVVDKTADTSITEQESVVSVRDKTIASGEGKMSDVVKTAGVLR
ncbi:hypothetical protein BaRGS_00028210 [Batillaria attramentaria]|uniref:Uncharacterized protein n=1 Tax=Batillaria attramentaria TaxID=370345 RepID=A0ABD0K0S0_9CAEN